MVRVGCGSRACISSPSPGRGSARRAPSCTVEFLASRRTPRTDKVSWLTRAGNARAASWIHPPDVASRTRAPVIPAAPRVRSGGTRAARRGTVSRRRPSTPRPAAQARRHRTCSPPMRCDAVFEAGRVRLRPRPAAGPAGASPALSCRTRAGPSSGGCAPGRGDLQCAACADLPPHVAQIEIVCARRAHACHHLVTSGLARFPSPGSSSCPSLHRARVNSPLCLSRPPQAGLHAFPCHIPLSLHCWHKYTFATAENRPLPSGRSHYRNVEPSVVMIPCHARVGAVRDSVFP